MLHRRCFRKVLEIMQRPNNLQNSNLKVFGARAKFRLAEVLHPGEESTQLQAEANEYLLQRLGSDLPTDQDMGELFDSLVIYWSR